MDAATTTEQTRETSEILIFRVEYTGTLPGVDPSMYSGLGPYKMLYAIRQSLLGNDRNLVLARTRYIRMINRHNHCKRHPGPGDEKLFPDSRHFFGFASLDNLCSWFSVSDRKDMSILGFSLVVYRIPAQHVTVSKTQAIFAKNMAKKIATLPIRGSKQKLQSQTQNLFP